MKIVLALLMISTCCLGATCTCTCCAGIGCTPAVAGSAQTTDCSTCNAALCQSQFPATCTTGNGQVSSSCTTPAPTNPPGTKTVWSGTYSINNACSQTQCCCAVGAFTMTQVDVQVSGTVSVAGMCGGATSAPFAVTLSSPSATSGSFGQNNLVKNGATVTATNTANAACSATLTCTSGDCLPVAACFHESTLINYKGQVFSLVDLQTMNKQPKECHVPHVVRSSGVSIYTSCSGMGIEHNKPLRLTNDHLVFTKAGLKAASDIGLHEVLYSNPEQTKECIVTKIVPETEEQVYFGLNCVDSIVLADGIKTSTFGRYHWIPSTWMKYASKMVGVQRASEFGDHIVNFLSRLKLF
jgi:hypothetical protein